MAKDKKISKKSDSPKVENLSTYVPTLRKLYNEEIVGNLKKLYNYKNIMEVPKIQYVSINIGLGDAKNNAKGLESAVRELALISGQKPIVTRAKKDISNFKIRKGWPVGCKVTLRSNMMYEFLERLISIALPRTRDFRGLSHKSFDGKGNYNFGIKEQIIFNEINYDKIQAVRGLNITLVTTSKTDNEAYELLKSFGFPLKEKPVKNSIEEAA
tara:strand:+ start:2008 stop:2646 length:639 start_codon:yes stop_codon:yes gene_type:complete